MQFLFLKEIILAWQELVFGSNLSFCAFLSCCHIWLKSASIEVIFFHIFLDSSHLYFLLVQLSTILVKSFIMASICPGRRSDVGEILADWWFWKNKVLLVWVFACQVTFCHFALLLSVFTLEISGDLLNRDARLLCRWLNTLLLLWVAFHWSVACRTFMGSAYKWRRLWHFRENKLFYLSK